MDRTYTINEVEERAEHLIRDNRQLQKNITDIEEEIRVRQAEYDGLVRSLEEYAYQPNYMVVYDDDKIVGLSSQQTNTKYYFSFVLNLVLLAITVTLHLFNQTNKLVQ